MKTQKPWTVGWLPILLLAGSSLTGADQPQWGEAWSRNLVSDERGLPDRFDPATGENVRWVAELGTEAHSTPVVAGGRVYIGTNNEVPRDRKHQGDRGVLMCLSEKDGSLQWQLVVPKLVEDKFMDWPKSGISSPATVEDGRVYVVSNRGEVLCLDANGLSDGNDGPYQEEASHMAPLGYGKLELGPLDADILWRFDLREGAGIWPHDAAHSSILIRGSHLYLNSGTGVDNTHVQIRTPEAPGLVVLEKETGRLLARDGEYMAPLTFHSTWSPPSMASVEGRERIFFCGGDGVVYGFKPLATTPAPGEVRELEKVWEFLFDPKAPRKDVHRFHGNRREGPSNFYGMPVFWEGRLYVAGGGDIFWGKNEAWVKCLDAGDGVREEDRLIWSYPLNKHTLATPAVHEGLVYGTDTDRYVHCVDAKTGDRVWTHEVEGDLWASTLIADGKVYVGSRSGDFWILRAGREREVLYRHEFPAPISATVTVANGTLYIATMTHLYAVAGR